MDQMPPTPPYETPPVAPAPPVAPPVMPTPQPMGPPPTSFVVKPKKNRFVWILIAVLALGAVTFAILSVLAFNEATKAKTTLEQQKKAAADKARTDQKAADQKAAELAAESPYRSYVAPLEYGSFEIKFPKNWSGYVDQERSSTNQVTLLVEPNFVVRNNGVDDLAPAKIVLIQRTLTEYLGAFKGTSTIKQSDFTVSGIKGAQLTGTFTDKRTTRIVAIPVRDKVLVFVNEDGKYAQQFNEILAQSKVVP